MPVATHRLTPPFAMRWAVLLLSLLLGCGAVGPAAAVAKPKAPSVTAIRCLPANSALCKPGVRARVGDDVVLRGRRLAKGQRVTFRWSKGYTTAKLGKKSGAGYRVTVPKRTALGTVGVTVKDRRGRRSNRVKLKIVATTPITTTPQPPPATAGPAVGSGTVPPVFSGAGMWIVDLAEADGGTPDALITRARQAGITTIFLKSANGAASQGSQFSASLVAAMHAGGIQLCAWQWVVGKDPDGEAAQAREAIRAGADCFVIDAEVYSGRYDSAQRYMKAVRDAAPKSYPIGFTSFAEPLSHPWVPYSVFLGPGGADVNLPQVYWGERSMTPAALSAPAAAGNRIYGRPMTPLGQTYGTASFDDVQQFRSIWRSYGAQGISWFRWGATNPDAWTALATEPPMLDAAGDPGWQLLAKGSSGDGVIWVQQHLAAVDPSVEIDGQFGPGTEAALRAFQQSRSLFGVDGGTTGATGPATWQALLKLEPKAVDWTSRPSPGG